MCPYLPDISLPPHRRRLFRFTGSVPEWIFCLSQVVGPCYVFGIFVNDNGGLFCEVLLNVNIARRFEDFRKQEVKRRVREGRGVRLK